AVAQVTASLTNGSSVVAQFTGSAPPALAALTPNLYIAMGAPVTWPVEAMVVSPKGAAVAGQSVNWSGCAGVAVQSRSSLSVVNGIAENTITAGPFSVSVTATASACLAGTASCVNFYVIPVQPSTEGLIGSSGTAQYVTAGQAFAPMVLHVTDAFGHPVAGATVTLEEAFYGWTQPCGAPGGCGQAPLIAQQRVLAVSGLDGSVTQKPISEGGLAGRLEVTAAVGTGTVLAIELQAHP
ncbi:MAG: hypothetical protein WA414_16210, partial [Acidobacteriaceae bacterium]